MPSFCIWMKGLVISRSVMSDSLGSRDCIVVQQAPLSVGFSREDYQRGLPFPPPRDLPNPGIKPGSPVSQEDSLPSEPPRKSCIWMEWLQMFSVAVFQDLIQKIIHVYEICKIAIKKKLNKKNVIQSRR